MRRYWPAGALRRCRVQLHANHGGHYSAGYDCCIEMVSAWIVIEQQPCGACRSLAASLQGSPPPPPRPHPFLKPQACPHNRFVNSQCYFRADLSRCCCFGKSGTAGREARCVMQVHFPVFVEGANLSMGDMHFSQVCQLLLHQTAQQCLDEAKSTLQRPNYE